MLPRLGDARTRRRALRRQPRRKSSVLARCTRQLQVSCFSVLDARVSGFHRLHLGLPWHADILLPRTGISIEELKKRRALKPEMRKAAQDVAIRYEIAPSISLSFDGCREIKERQKKKSLDKKKNVAAANGNHTPFLSKFLFSFTCKFAIHIV